MSKEAGNIFRLVLLGAVLASMGGAAAAETTETPVSAPSPAPSATPSPSPSATPEDFNNPPSRTYNKDQYTGPYVPLPVPPPAASEDEPRYSRRGRRRRSSPGPKLETTTSLLNFRFAGIGAYQTGVSVYSLMASWNPQISLKDGKYLGFNLGGTELTNALSQNTPVLEYQVTVGLPIVAPMGIEFGLGFQTWFNNGETDPLLSANLCFKIPNFFVDRLFFGYSAYLMNYFYTSEVKAGFGLSF